MLVLQIEHGDDGWHGARARLEIGEWTEPEVKPFMLDELTQAGRLVPPWPRRDPAKAERHRLPRAAAQARQRLSRRLCALRKPARILITERWSDAPGRVARRGAGQPDPTARRRVGKQQIAVPVGCDDHVFVHTAREQLGEQTPEVHFSAAHLPGTERNRIHPDAHLTLPVADVRRSPLGRSAAGHGSPVTDRTVPTRRLCRGPQARRSCDATAVSRRWAEDGPGGRGERPGRGYRP